MVIRSQSDVEVFTCEDSLRFVSTFVWFENCMFCVHIRWMRQQTVLLFVVVVRMFVPLEGVRLAMRTLLLKRHSWSVDATVESESLAYVAYLIRTFLCDKSLMILMCTSDIINQKDLTQK